MKAKILLKGLGSVQAPPVHNGDRADAAEVHYQLSGDQPLKNAEFVVLGDNVKRYIHRIFDHLRVAKANHSRLYCLGSSTFHRRKAPLASVALLATMTFAGFAFGGIEEAKKWVDKEFQPSTLSKEEQMKEMAWFIKAAEPFRGL